ncbi:MAG: hypothetical protein H0W88_10200 [Parachlamydiaceae bacterium]|nr:hypothetical protein [Parachlamydiaceae bacterium]
MSTVGNRPEDLQTSNAVPGQAAISQEHPSIEDIITFVSSPIVVTKNKEQTKADLQKFKQHEIEKMNDCMRRLTEVSRSSGWDKTKNRTLLGLLGLAIGAGNYHSITGIVKSHGHDEEGMMMMITMLTMFTLFSVLFLATNKEVQNTKDSLLKINKTPPGIGMLKGQLETYVRRYGLPSGSRLAEVLDNNGKITLKMADLENEKLRIATFFDGLINDENLLHDMTRTSEGQILLEVLKPAALDLKTIKQTVTETAVAQDTATELNERLKKEEGHEHMPYGVASLMLDFLAEVPPD